MLRPRIGQGVAITLPLRRSRQLCELPIDLSLLFVMFCCGSDTWFESMVTHGHLSTFPHLFFLNISFYTFGLCPINGSTAVTFVLAKKSCLPNYDRRHICRAHKVIVCPVLRLPKNNRKLTECKQH